MEHILVGVKNVGGGMASKFERFNAILDSFKDIIKAKKENIHLSAVITFMNATYVKVILTLPSIPKNF